MDEHNTETGRAASIWRLHETPVAAARQAHQPAIALRAPRCLADTGLPAMFVSQLVLKSILLNGKSQIVTRRSDQAALPDGPGARRDDRLSRA